MKKSFVLIILILMIVLISTAFADGGWLNAESEIQKSVQANSPKPPRVNFIDLNASMTNVQNVFVGKTRKAKKVPVGCEEKVPYVFIEFFSAQKIENVLDGKEEWTKHNNFIQGIVVYSGKNLNEFFACPNPMNMGTYTITNAGTYTFPLSFMSITTNASITVTVQDGGHLTNVSNSNDTIQSWNGFVSLTATASLTSLLKRWHNKMIKTKKLQRVLFRKPKTFSAPKASFEIDNPTRELQWSLWSWWLKVKVPYDTPAGVYKDTIKITVHANVDW